MLLPVLPAPPVGVFAVGAGLAMFVEESGSVACDRVRATVETNGAIEIVTGAASGMGNATIKYLDDAYGEVIRCLDPYVTDEDYQDLWGWDTTKHGTHAGRGAGGPRLILSSPSAYSGS